MNNPIFIEFYPHENCDCYKIKNPWTQYKVEILVLCRVDEGLDKARRLAMESLTIKMFEALKEPVKR